MTPNYPLSLSLGFQAAFSTPASSSSGSDLVLRDTTQSGREFGPNRGALAQALNEM